MKKLISLLLAVSVMAASTVASAAALKAGGQRNPGAANVEGVATGNSRGCRWFCMFGYGYKATV